MAALLVGIVCWVCGAALRKGAPGAETVEVVCIDCEQRQRARTAAARPAPWGKR